MKQTVVKILCMVLVLIMAGGTMLAGCSQFATPVPRVSTPDSSDISSEINEITVNVKVVGPDDKIILDTPVVGEFNNAFEAFHDCFNQNGLVSDGLSDEFVTSIDNIEGTEKDGWLFFVNGEIASKGIKNIKVEDGMQISYEWKNFDQAFG